MSIDSRFCESSLPPSVFRCYDRPRSTVRLEQPRRPTSMDSTGTVSSGASPKQCGTVPRQPPTLHVWTDLSPELAVDRRMFTEINDVADALSWQTFDEQPQQHQHQQRSEEKTASVSEQRQSPERHNQHPVQDIPNCYINVFGGSSTVDRCRISTARERVKASGFYHGSLSASEARRVVHPYPSGTFLIRDSSERSRYPFTLTVRIDSPSIVATSIRIVYDSGHFRFDGVPEAVPLLSGFQCVLELIRHHVRMNSSTSGSGRSISNRCSNGNKGGSKLKFGMVAFVEVGSEFSDDEAMALPVVLRKPLPVSRSPSALKHLCRRRINGLLDGQSVSRLCLMPTLKQYLADYPSDL